MPSTRTKNSLRSHFPFHSLVARKRGRYIKEDLHTKAHLPSYNPERNGSIKSRNKILKQMCDQLLKHVGAPSAKFSLKRMMLLDKEKQKTLSSIFNPKELESALRIERDSENASRIIYILTALGKKSSVYGLIVADLSKTFDAKMQAVNAMGVLKDKTQLARAKMYVEAMIVQTHTQTVNHSWKAIHEKINHYLKNK